MYGLASIKSINEEFSRKQRERAAQKAARVERAATVAKAFPKRGSGNAEAFG